MTETKIIKLLLEHGRKEYAKERQDVIAYSNDDDCNRLTDDLENYPHAFVIGCVIDRMMRTELAWEIPYRLKERIGSFEFEDLHQMEEHELCKHFNHPHPLHRYHGTMPKYVHSAIQIIGKKYDGDASKIWSDTPSSGTVVYRFLQIHGVGPKIATMATNLLVRDFKIKLKDHYSIDVSADTHVKRVLRRLELTEENASSEQIIYRARGLHPEFPGLLDYPCWRIGKDWCTPRNPLCDQCYMQEVCPTAEEIRKR